MVTRRRFLSLALAGLATHTLVRTVAAQETPTRLFLPTVAGLTQDPTPEPTPEPTPGPIYTNGIVAPAYGTVEQAVAWFAPRADESYTDYDLSVIFAAYRDVGTLVGIDWFTAVAQVAHETGHLTSFWSLRPQRNPAGIGVTGVSQTYPPADTTGWAYNTQRNQWERGLSFITWADDAIPAHLGRLLAYALRDDQANESQRALIAKAESYRPFPADRRGVAPTWVDLNNRWAVPGTTYGQTLLALAERMRA